jgi:Uma2 family endonuclease
MQCAGISLADDSLRAVFPHPTFWIRQNMPLVLGPCTDPVPNLAVVAGSVREFADTHPTTSPLVVEVSDGSLSLDTGEKAELYAAAGIADYWVVDLNNRVVIIHRDPRPDPARQSGSSFGTVRTLTPGQTVSPLAAPQATVGVGDLLP